MASLELAPKIEAVIILDNSGNRLCAKYYSNKEEFNGTAAQTKFQNAILNKVNRSVQPDVLLFNDHLVLYASSANVRIFVVSASSANELVIDEVLRAIESAITTLLKGTIDTRGIVDNMDYVLLAIDELVEQGTIFETEGDDIAFRVLMKEIAPMTQETLFEAYQRARDQWLK